MQFRMHDLYPTLPRVARFVFGARQPRAQSPFWRGIYRGNCPQGSARLHRSAQGSLQIGCTPMRRRCARSRTKHGPPFAGPYFTDPTAGNACVAPWRAASNRLSASSQIASSRLSGQPCCYQSSRAQGAISSCEGGSGALVWAVESVWRWLWWWFFIRDFRLSDGPPYGLVRR